MSSHHRLWPPRLMTHSIVARTTILVVGVALLTGMLFAGLVSWQVQLREHARVQEQLNELLSTIESAASVACYLNDTELAKEIATGLLSNRLVERVRIDGDKFALYDAQAQHSSHTLDPNLMVISRIIYSPFISGKRVGAVSLYVREERTRQVAWGYTRYTIAMLLLLVAVVALAIALIVFALVTRPIKSISDELHRLELRTGVHLRIPSTHESDEIGRCVKDVNALIERVTYLLENERRMRLEHEINERRMRLVFDKADAGIFTFDGEGRLLSHNPAFRRITGLHDCSDVPLLKTLFAAHARQIEGLIENARQGGADAALDLELQRFSGANIWVEISIRAMEPDLFQGVLNDITDRKQREAAVEDLASHDALTGLLNRRGLEQAFADLVRRGSLLATVVMQIDLDYFKRVNDTHGHEAGDRVLRHVARILEQSLRHSDIVARPGGDEFVIVLRDVDHEENVKQLAATIVERVAQQIDLGNGRGALVGASIGIAFAEGQGDSPERLMRRADAAMYQAKQAGRGCIHIAPPSDPIHPSPLAA